MLQLWIVGTFSINTAIPREIKNASSEVLQKNVLRASCNRSSLKSWNVPDAMNAPEVILPCSFTHYIATVSAAFQTLQRPRINAVLSRGRHTHTHIIYSAVILRPLWAAVVDYRILEPARKPYTTMSPVHQRPML